jgi:penicillin G amidase
MAHTVGSASKTGRVFELRSTDACTIIAAGHFRQGDAVNGTTLKRIGIQVLLFAAAVTAAGDDRQMKKSTTAAAGDAAVVMTVRGLERPVDLIVDRWGVPHIFARSEHDVFMAQGFNAARDRLFQLDLWRRRGLGLLSEAFGPDFIQQDRAARLFLYRGDIAAEWRAYGPEHVGRIEGTVAAFTQGINAYIDYVTLNPEKLPWEFRNIGYSPARWQPEDVVRIRSHGLTRNALSEIARARTVCSADVASDQIRSGLQPAWEASVPEGLDACLPREVAREFQLATEPFRLARSRLAGGAASQLLALMDEALDTQEGSNNWVVAPSRSATGRAIMANDPHRAYSTPSLRYIAHLSAPGLDVIGAGEPALPGIHIGHNGTIAFGLTIFPIDQEDLYVYDLNPSNPGQYRYKGAWETFRTVKETIPVRRGDAVTVELLFTRHGPVIFIDKEKGRAFALRTCWLEPGMSPYFCSVESMRARDFTGFREAMSRWGAPTVNHVYADAKGNIGWLPRGMTPRRESWDGLLPVPGDGRFEWNGFWKSEDLPSVYNPAQGWFATANQMNIPPGYPYRERRLGFEWTNPARFNRISEVLGALKLVSLEDSERLQNDIVSTPARRLIALLGALQTGDSRARAALELLRGWDCRETRGSAAAALYEVWLSRHLRPGFRAAVLPPAAAAAMSATDLSVMLDALEAPAPRFGNDASARRNALLISTLSEAYGEVSRLLGSDPSAWQWGRLHFNRSEHVFSDAVESGLRAMIDVGPLATGGSESTPNQSQYRTEDFRQTNGPSFRIVVDVGNWDNSRAVNFPGQSGDPANPHYRDLAPLWQDGKYFPLLYTRPAIEKAAESRLRLVPAR